MQILFILLLSLTEPGFKLQRCVVTVLGEGVARRGYIIYEL